MTPDQIMALPAAEDRYRACAAVNLTQLETAALLGVSRPSVSIAAKRYQIVFRPAKRGVRRGSKRPAARSLAQGLADALGLGPLPAEMTRRMPGGVSVRRAARQFLRWRKASGAR